MPLQITNWQVIQSTSQHVKVRSFLRKHILVENSYALINLLTYRLINQISDSWTTAVLIKNLVSV
jgi:hypothetical protein